MNSQSPMIGFSSLIKNHFFSIFIFCLAFLLIPLHQLEFLVCMPGDTGDARLNNYFLENIFQFFIGKSESLWHLSFFYPYPYVLGFSDNLFGASPLYLMPRFLGIAEDTSFQLWFLLSYFANYFSAYYAFRKLRFSQVAASFGALVFAFALPVTVRQGHAQLCYRFGVPLATLFFTFFLQRKNWKYIFISGGWLVWQYYCSIYIGFFTSILILACLLAYCLKCPRWTGLSFIANMRGFIESITQCSLKEKIIYLLASLGIFVLMLALFFPYLQVSRLYKFERDSSEIASMLPRPESYFLTSVSSWYSSKAEIFSQLPMRHEHQMFFGIGVWVFLLLGWYFYRKQKVDLPIRVILLSFPILILCTLYWNGYSIWLLFVKAPLFSAIRAMARIDLVMLFPVAAICSISMENIQKALSKNLTGSLNTVIFTIFLAIILEFSLVNPGTSAKSIWRERLVEKEKLLPTDLQKDSILFFSGCDEFFAGEIDAMWVGLRRNLPVLNGYSGWSPKGFNITFGQHLNELPRRLMAYQFFSKDLSNKKTYAELISKVVPIGFAIDSADYIEFLNNFEGRTISETNEDFPKEKFQFLKPNIVGKWRCKDQEYAIIEILNPTDTPVASISKTNHPIRVSWRFTNSTGSPLTGWDNRADLPFDIPAQGSLTMTLPIAKPDLSTTVGEFQVSLVQDGVFWLHDLGVAPSIKKWNEIQKLEKITPSP